MLLSAECVYITSRVDVRNGKTYASCSLENNDSVIQVPVSSGLIPVLEQLKKYTAYACTFEYDRVNSPKGSFTIFRLYGIKEL